MRLLTIALVTLASVASCSSSKPSADAADASPADAQQESASPGDVLHCSCGASAVITAPSVATEVSADTCTVTQNGDGPHYSAQTTTGAPCAST